MAPVKEKIRYDRKSLYIFKYNTWFRQAMIKIVEKRLVVTLKYRL